MFNPLLHPAPRSYSLKWKKVSRDSSFERSNFFAVLIVLINVVCPNTSLRNIAAGNDIKPVITEAFEYQLDGDGNSLLDEAKLHFQQDGVHPNYVYPVPQWLNKEFSN